MTTSARLPSRPVPIRRRVEHVMGMPISLAVRGRHADSAAGHDAWRAVIADLQRVDQIFSTYREDSLINRLGRGEVTLEECPPDVAEVLQLASDAEHESAGAFSIVLPSADGDLRLDPSGVVKGWATQRASAYLAALEDTDFCLSAGGDMVCLTSDPDRPAWQIGIEDPHDPSRIFAVIPVRTGAVATSGSAHRGAHIVDPRSGQVPVGVASVSVVAASLTRADIDATTAYVQGPQAARWLQTRPIRAALVVWADRTCERVAGTTTG
jgi:thiamine biosynthesis lipoprotein